MIDGEGLTDSIFTLIEDHFPRPLVNRLSEKPAEADYELAVKHLHSFGGCEGRPIFGKDLIVYETAHQEDTRTWRVDHEIAGIWPTGRYDLAFEVFE